VTVAPANDTPNAGNDTVAATEDQALTIDPATLLINDGDLDGDALTITRVSGAAGGTVAIVDGQIVFTPTPTSMAPAASATRSATAMAALRRVRSP
jgi:hypothetical protein